MISDTFKNTIWIYYETNLKARTRKEYWNVVKNFDKGRGGGSGAAARCAGTEDRRQAFGERSASHHDEEKL